MEMPIDFIKEILETDFVAKKERVQNVIEGDILVPDSRPDISRIISVDGRIRVQGETIEDGKVIVEGTVNFNVLYVSESEEESLCNVESSTVFKQEIELENITPKMQSEVAVEIEHIDFTMNNERKIGVKAIANLTCNVIEKKNSEIMINAEGPDDLQILRNKFNYSSVIEKRSEEILIKDAFEIEDNLPEIKEIIKLNSRISEKETKITDKKIIVGGVLLVEIMYITEENRNLLCHYKMEIPFTNFIEMDEALSDMMYSSSIKLNSIDTKLIENIRGENRIIEIEAFVQLDAKIIENIEKNLIVDVYSPKQGLELEKKMILFSRRLETKEKSVSLSESLNVPVESPGIEKIVSVKAKTLVSDYHEEDGKIVIEGVLGIEVLYMAGSDLQLLYSFEQEIPFRQYVELGSAYEDIDAEIELSDARVKYELVGKNRIDIVANFDVECEVYLSEEAHLISEITEAEIKEGIEERPSLTIYSIQSGDTLWEIAKKYNSTVEIIIESNNIEDPQNLKINEYLLIQKESQFQLN
ncbi:MAG: peptidoglycan-binding protein [Alkaliphilus sp.]|nr:DUF3794 domain-containing protein [bacterium AH-315-E09]PHS36096.1 MAG: peptidoglycan-binding protein [Alkaliphilus sp.]